MRLSQRMCWSLGAACVAAGLGLPWWAARRAAAEGGPVVETVRLRPALVRLPAGSFLMGSLEGKIKTQKDEAPQRFIDVPAFSMCQTEVTQGQYNAVIGVNPSMLYFAHRSDNGPIFNVSWYDAVAYLNKLTALESEALMALGEKGLSACYEGSGEDVRWIEGCTGYRLPTEAEWEYAARAGTTTRWSFGDDPAVAEEYAWFFDNAEGKAHAVGTKKPNPWGLYDMHGNMWEWVWDVWDVYDVYKTPYVVNGGVGDRVLRGGSDNNLSSTLRSAIRAHKSPELQYLNNGFRCARGPGPQR